MPETAKLQPVESEAAGPGAVRRTRSVSASEMLFREILRGLYDGRYAPGQRLVEVDLSQEYDVSRFVVREAFARLAAEGVASISFNRGAHIPRLTRKQATDTFLVMEQVFGLAANLAAQRIHASPHAEALAQSVAHLLTFKEGGDFFEFGRALSLFFRSITKVGANEELQRLLPTLRVHLIRVQFRGFPTAAEIHRTAAFRDIHDAIAAGDAAAAEARMRAYFAALARDIGALPDRAFAPPAPEPGPIDGDKPA